MNRRDDEVRQACIATALEAYQHAAISGLCREGAWEAAISAMSMLDLDMVLHAGNTIEINNHNQP